MPFTPAHPALILPLLKINPRYISATGLIVGSVTPDFEYFFKMSVNGEHSHTLAGLFYFDLPVAFFLALVFHLVVKIKFIDNLPSFFQTRLRVLRDLDFVNYLKGNYIAFIFAALIGAASHIFWDAFTHGDGFFVHELGVYNGSFLPYEGVRYPLWYALQHISTYVGLAIVLAYVLMMKPVAGSTEKPFVVYWLIVVIVTVVAIMIRFKFDPLSADLGNFVVTAVSALCLSFLIAGMIPIRTSSYG